MGAGKECSFWLAGTCNYAEGYCKRGAHTEGKKGTKPYKQDFGQPPTTSKGQSVVTLGAGSQAMSQEQKLQSVLQLLAALQQ